MKGLLRNVIEYFPRVKSSNQSVSMGLYVKVNSLHPTKERFPLKRLAITLRFFVRSGVEPRDGCQHTADCLSWKQAPGKDWCGPWNTSQHSSQAVASECCAQHSNDNILGQVLKITFYGQSVSPPNPFMLVPHIPLKAWRSPRSRTSALAHGRQVPPPLPVVPPLGANQHIPEPP